MGRVLLVLLLAAAALASPAVRARLAPYAKPALDPVYEWSARSKVREIARMVQSERSVGRAVPSPKTFPEFVARRYPGEGGTDPWGVPFYLKQQRAGMLVGSAGRDGVRGTADDIVESLGVGGPGR